MSFDLATYTLVHVLLSVVGIVAGLVVVGALVAGVLLERWVAVFLLTTVLTNVTGFGFPFKGLLPSHLVAILSLLVLPLAFTALYGRRLAGRWRTVFVLVSVFALYLNVFVLIAQLLQKTPVLAAIAPDPGAPAFGLAQLVFLALFIGLGWAAVKGFRVERVPAAVAPQGATPAL